MDDGDWTCPSCGARVAAEFDLCLSCGSDRIGQRVADFGAPEIESIDEISIRPDTAHGDAMATRAWRAAILSPFICPPTLTFYSLWIILRIALSDVELSEAGKAKFYLSMLANLTVWIGLSIVFRYFL